LKVLLEHQQKDYLHSDIYIKTDPKNTICMMGGSTDAPFVLSVPANLGKTLAQAIARKINAHLSPNQWREGIAELNTDKKTISAFAKIHSKPEDLHITLSTIDNHLKNPDISFTDKQIPAIENMLNSRAGIVGISGPTHGSTITLLYTLEQLLQRHTTPRRISLQPIMDMDSEKAFHKSMQRLPAYTLLMISNGDLPGVWEIITQAAAAGSVVIIGVPKKDTPSLIQKLRKHIPNFLLSSLFRGTVVHTPFQTSCPNCAIPMPLHPDVQEQFSSHADPEILKNLKSAHSPGCQECDFRGHGPNLSTIELCTPDHLPKNIDRLTLEGSLRNSGMKTNIADLVERAHQIPVPLERAARLTRV